MERKNHRSSVSRFIGERGKARPSIAVAYPGKKREGGRSWLFIITGSQPSLDKEKE